MIKLTVYYDRKISFIKFFLFFFVFLSMAFSAEPAGKQLDYKTEEVNLDIKKYEITRQTVGKETNHFYTYIALNSGIETNPNHNVKERKGQSFTDKYYSAISNFIYLFRINEDFLWGISTDIANKSYSRRQDLSEYFFKIESGPCFYFRSTKLTFCGRPIYYLSRRDKKLYYDSKYPGAFLKLTYSPTKKFNILGSYEYEPRNYKTETSDDSDSNINTALVKMRYNFSNSVFHMFEFYREFNAINDYLDKYLYGIGLDYIYFLTKKLYIGFYYERIVTNYKSINIGDIKKRIDTENYYTGVIGYQFGNNWVVEGAYTKEKIYSNLDSISTTHSDLFNLSIVYRFNLHK